MNIPYSNTENIAEKVSRISWGAIFAGTLTALAVVFLLNLLGLGIGLSSIDPMTESDPLKGLGTGTLIWMGLSNLAALFVGGMIAGRMSGYTSAADGGLHGFLSWALYAIISVYLLTSTIGSMVSGMSSAVSGIFGDSQSDKITQVLEKAKEKGKSTTSLSFDDIKKEVFEVMNKAEDYNVLPEDATENTRETLNKSGLDKKEAINKLNIDKNINRFINDLTFDLNDKGDLKINVEGDQEYFNKVELKNYLANNTNLSEAEIDGMINKWDRNIETAVNKAEKYYAKAKTKVVEISDKAADVVGTVSLVAFGLFLIGALAAYFGGATGSPELTVSEERRREKID